MPICMDRVPMGDRGLKILEQSKLRYSNRLLSFTHSEVFPLRRESGMIQAPERTAQDTQLLIIASEVRELTDAIREQNELIKSCIITPDGSAPRILIGICGAVEVIEI